MCFKNSARDKDIKWFVLLQYNTILNVSQDLEFELSLNQ